MANMESQFVLASSGISAQMNNTYKAMRLVSGEFERMQVVSSTAIDVNIFQSVSREAASAADIIKDKFYQAMSEIKARLPVSEILNLADSMSQTRTRLAAITGDIDSAASLQDKIMDSATRAGVPYQEMADAVADMALQAGSAFSGNDEITAFTELLNKQFAISGASAEGMSMSMDKITQAMAAGTLGGEAFADIMSEAPAIADTIADYLGLSVDKVQELAAGGQLTAGIVKSSMLSSADEINAGFSEIPYTFSQVANMVKNVLLKTFDPLLQVIGSVANWIYDNFAIVKPIILGIATAILIWQAAQLAMNAVNTVAAAAQLALNSAMLACPITWIVIAIMLIIAAIYVLFAAINKVMGTSISATGVISGAFAALGAAVGNIFIKLWNIVAMFVNFIGNIFNDPVAAIKMLFYDLNITIIGYILSAAKAIENLINKIPGVEVDMTSDLENLQKGFKAARQQVKSESGWKEYAAQKDYIDISSAISKGYNAGSNFANEFGSGMGSFDYENIATGVEGINENTGSTAASLENSSGEYEYLRDIAEQETINKFTTAEVNIDMSGMTNRIDSDMDVDNVINMLTDGFAEALETTAEGVHE